MINTVKAVVLGGLLLFSALLAQAQTPPFTQCPAVGLNTSCAILIVINPGGTITVLADPNSPNNGPYDGSDDTLVGVLNNSGSAVSALPLSSSTDIFGFEGDGLCTASPRPAACPFGSTGYEGPGTSFSGINGSGTSGTVNFSPALASGASTYFSLEEALTASQIQIGGTITGGGGILPALQCVANAGVPPTVRAEGLTELVGDVVLNCTGGKPTDAGQLVAQANVTIFLSTNITSRRTASPVSEALLIVDEPHSASNPGVALQVCDPSNATAGVCQLRGRGNGVGTYNPANADNLIGVAGANVPRSNVYQGRQTGVNQITFFGVPIDPPGTGTRIIRITNVRGNANQLGVSSTLVPTQITEYISITGSTSVPVNNPQQTVAFVQPGLVSSVRFAVTFVQCLDANVDIAKDPTKAIGSGGQNGQQFSIRFDEGFGTAWKVRNINQVITPASATTVTDVNQNVPGAIYNTEAGFQNNTTDPSPNPPGAVFSGLVTGASNSSQFSSTARGLNAAGVASQGTRLYINFGTVPNGTQLFVPTRVSITAPITGATTGYAVLVSTDANGALPNGGPPSLTAATNGTVAPVSISSGTGLAVYEVMQSDPFSLERMTVPVAVAFVANSGNNLPAPGVQSTISAGFAPLSNVGTASDTAPIPRFAPSTTPKNSYNVVKCSCNILFPFVSNQGGYDTGLVISNTSVDPFGTTPQTGTVTVNYYSGGTPPPAQTTNATVPAGQQLIFTLSGGGNFGIGATPRFQGYIIAQAQFQFCHAFAYLSAQGALATSSGASLGYLGIILDAPGLNRTGQVGEVQAH